MLNGLDYSVNNHSPGQRYMATGKLDSLAYPTFAALVAACRGPACPLSFLTFGNYSATPGNIVAMSRVPYLPSLQRIANADSIEGNLKSPYHDDFALSRIEEALAAEHASRPLLPRLPREERGENMLYAAQVNSKAMERITPHIPKDIPKERLSPPAEIALASFKAGVCVSANLSIGQFDSHANNDKDQMKLIPELLAGIAYVIRRAEQLGLREKLVVIMQSEMGRTPTYNAGNGKDHWSIGSIMFLGPGIKGNRVIGATDDRQFHVPLDPQKLMPDRESGIRVRPEHIHEALREFAGIADHPLSRKFPLGVTEKERLRGLWGCTRRQASDDAYQVVPSHAVVVADAGAAEDIEGTADGEIDAATAEVLAAPQIVEDLAAPPGHRLAGFFHRREMRSTRRPFPPSVPPRRRRESETRHSAPPDRRGWLWK